MSGCNGCGNKCPLKNQEKTQELLKQNQGNIDKPSFQNAGIHPCKKCIDTTQKIVIQIIKKP